MLEGRLLGKICVVSLTLCAMLVLALINVMRDVKDDISQAVTNSIMAISIAGGAWVGAAEREVGLIFLPFGWLLATSALLVLRRAGVTGLGKLVKVDGRVGSWVSSASLATLVAVHVSVYGFGEENLLFLCAWQGIGFVYKWLG